MRFPVSSERLLAKASAALAAVLPARFLPNSRGLTVANDEPMTASVAGRYASALLELAQEQNAVAAVEADLQKFETLLSSSPELLAFVRSPILSADDQLRALSAILTRAGIGGGAGNFLLLAAKNRRLFVVPDMIRTFRSLAARARGETAVQVTSAIALSEEQMAALKAELKSMAGRDVTLTTNIDPSILGGLVVKIGSRMVDSSIRTKLSNLGVALKA